MFSFLQDARSRSAYTLPLFPLRTVLFPGGLLPLKVFEQRYIEMTKTCLKEGQPFGVCLLKEGQEIVVQDGLIRNASFTDYLMEWLDASLD